MFYVVAFDGQCMSTFWPPLPVFLDVVLSGKLILWLERMHHDFLATPSYYSFCNFFSFNVRYEAFTAVKIQFKVSWVVMPCSVNLNFLFSVQILWPSKLTEWIFPSCQWIPQAYVFLLRSIFLSLVDIKCQWSWGTISQSTLHSFT